MAPKPSHCSIARLKLAANCLSSNSNASSGSETESESDNQVKQQKQQRPMTESLWKDVEVKSVKNLPEGIDGLKVYKLIDFKFTRSHKRTALSDGRKWSKDCPTIWAGHRRTRYANCKGS